MRVNQDLLELETAVTKILMIESEASDGAMNGCEMSGSASPARVIGMMASLSSAGYEGNTVLSHNCI